jgi:hypothetical protein
MQPKFYYVTNSMEQSSSWEANVFWASEEIPRVLWNLKVRNLVHSRLPLVWIQSQINPIRSPILFLEDPF